MKYLVLAFTLAVSGWMWQPAKAEKSVEIIVVDVDRAVLQSKAGKSMTKQLEKQTGDWEKKNEAVNTELRADLEKFQEERSLLAEDAQRSRFEELRQKEITKRQELQAEREAINAGGQKALQEIVEVADKEVKALARKHKADLVVRGAALIYTAASLDVTNELILALNKKLTKVKVTPVKAETN